MKTRNSLLIIGAGMAGLRAAVSARSANPNLEVILVTAGRVTVAGCSPKTHGVNAAINPGDTVESHIEDTITGGGGINCPDLVEILCHKIPDEIRWLETQGVVFDRKDKLFDTGFYGGSSHGRSIHIRDMAGRSIVQVLSNLAIQKGVHIREERTLLDLIVRDGRCHGAVFYNHEAGATEVFHAGVTILATGGGACVFPIATISADKEASGIMQAFMHGATLMDMEMVQFHPTGLNRPGQPGHGEIMEEELRSMGARLLNRDGRAFMQDYDPRRERATRDIVSRSTFLEVRAGRGTVSGGVLFDVSGVDKGTLMERFPFMLSRLEAYGVDLTQDAVVEISPAAHFLMGGLKINPCAETSITHLLACGEDAGGIHGGNRLGGNGIADALVFGRVAGERAAVLANNAVSSLPSPGAFSAYAMPGQIEKELVADLKKIMWTNAGLVRSAASLDQADAEISSLFGRASGHLQEVPCKDCSAEHVRGRSLLQKLMLARTIVSSARARTNSVGSHFREDAVSTALCYNTHAHLTSDYVPVITTHFHAALERAGHPAVLV